MKVKNKKGFILLYFFEWSPGIWNLCADVSEHSVPSS